MEQKKPEVSLSGHDVASIKEEVAGLVTIGMTENEAQHVIHTLYHQKTSGSRLHLAYLLPFAIAALVLSLLIFHRVSHIDAKISKISTEKIQPIEQELATTNERVTSLEGSLSKTDVIDIEVKADKPVAKIGYIINYHYQITNTSHLTLTNLVINYNLLRYSQKLAPLGAGQSITLSNVYTVTNSLPNPIMNEVIVEGTWPSDQVVRDTHTTSTTVDGN
ncbi:MAG: DUF7507 domain-containing protein [Ardenticatenaceae bacterium]